MQWKVKYRVAYPDFERMGETACMSRGEALAWVKLRDIATTFITRVEIWHGPKVVATWIAGDFNELMRVLR